MSDPIKPKQPTAYGGRIAISGLVGLSVLLAMACGGSVESPESETAAEPPVTPMPSTDLPAPAPQPVAPPVPSPEQLAQLEAQVNAAPSDRSARRQFAIALFAARKRDAAVEQFEKLASEAGDARALNDLANAYGFMSRMDDAVATYKKVLKIEPDNATALFNLGEVAFLHGDTEEAIGYYRKALAARADYSRAYYQLARALEHKSDYREAYTTYARVLDFDPKTPEELLAYDDALYRMASLDITMGAHERAEEMLLALLEANPNHDSAHYAYGQLLLQLGRLDEAQKQLEAHMLIQAQKAPTTQVATGD